MFYHIALFLKDSFVMSDTLLDVGFRAVAGLTSALCMSIGFGPKFIDYSRKTFQSKVRPFTPESHQSKNNTPIMGGCFILMVVTANILLWCNLSEPEPWLFMFVLIGFGAIGFIDDLYKIRYQKGLLARQKFIAQLVVSLAVLAAWIYLKSPADVIFVPFFKGLSVHLGWLFIPWLVFVMVAMSNAVNLTDGLDGLATGVLLLNVSTFSIVGYVAGNYILALYLNIPFTGSVQVAIIGAILIGALLGFLWFNAHPAQIFMGDVGSLSLGATLAFMAIVSRQELLLPIAGGIFVLEVLSVIGQYVGVKYFGKRLFKMAPIHHHFELLGWKEPKIVARFTIVSAVLCLLALLLL